MTIKVAIPKKVKTVEMANMDRGVDTLPLFETKDNLISEQGE